MFSDVWGFSWKLQSLTEAGGSLPRWPGLHVALTIGLLECPLDGALAPREQVIQEVVLEVRMP